MARSLLRWTPLLLSLTLLLAACGGTPSTPTLPPAGTGDVQLLTGSGDVRLGPNRLLLALLHKDGTPVRAAAVKLQFRQVDSNGPGPVRSETEAQYLGQDSAEAQSLYSTRVSFDADGSWQADATITLGGKLSHAASRFEVRAKTGVPTIGESVPASRNPTIPDTPIEQLTSQRPVGDPDFYKLTIADALSSGKPTVIIFATPAFCQTRQCGPALEQVQALKKKYADRLNFIHIEIFQRPDLLLQNAGAQRLAPTVSEWQLESEPWLFIVDAKGKVSDRFEGYAPGWEVEPSIQATLAR